MEFRMEPSTSEDDTVKEPLSTAEADAAVLCRGNRKANFLKNIGVVIPSHKSVPKFQLQLQLDSEKKRRQELESIVDEYKKAKEHADADKIKYEQDLNRVIKDQEPCIALIKRMLAKLAAA